MKKNPRKCIILRWVACTEDLIFDKKKHIRKNHLLRDSDQDCWKFKRFRSYRRIKAEAAEIMNVIREIFQ